MKKWSPFIAAILGAILLVVQQKLQVGEMDLKVVGFAALIAAIGAAGSFLKGKGTTILGILGTVLYTFYTIYQSGTFTWNEFILSAVVAILTMVTPSIVPEKDDE